MKMNNLKLLCVFLILSFVGSNNEKVLGEDEKIEAQWSYLVR